MALDEATAALLAQMAAGGGKALHEMTPTEARGFLAAMRGETPRSAPEMTSVTNTRVPVSGGFVPLRVLVPNEDPRGVIVYYHGGGWVLGTIEDSDLLGRQLAQRTGCVVVLVDYRLAPEYRYPVAVDDSWAALQWVNVRIEELAGRVVPLVVAGDSAGGNLAAVMALRAKAAGGPAIAAQVLAYPVTDCDLDTSSYTDPENQLMLSRDSMVWFWDHYAPEQAARAHRDASPLRAVAFAGLPPAIILTAEHDVLRDEGEVYATQLVKAKVPVTHQRFTGQMHGFFTMVGLLPGAAAGMEFVAGALDGYLTSDLVAAGTGAGQA